MRSTSRSPGCAAWLDPSMSTSTTTGFSAGTVPFRFPFIIVMVFMAVILSCSPLRQYIAKAKVHHIGVRILGARARRREDRPRAPAQVRILGDDLQPSVVLIRPQRGDHAECAFLNGPVRRVRRSGETKANASETQNAVARRSWRRSQESEVTLEVRAAVVAVERVARRSLIFKAADSGT